jgi:hypothetical protein
LLYDGSLRLWAALHLLRDGKDALGFQLPWAA